MPSQPLISVLLCAYNGERYLASSLESILAQTFTDFELVVVNDGSTDATGQILEQYAARDARIKIIANQKKMGLTKSLNVGLKACSGKYLARQDADDISVPERLQTQYDFMETHPAVALCGCQGWYLNAQGEKIGEKNLPTDYAVIKKNFLRNNQFIHSGWCARLEILAAAGGYDESFKKSQDYELALRLAARHQMVNLPERLVSWRVRGDSLSFTGKRQEWDALRARLWAIARYGYPKVFGVVQIILRFFYLLLPQSLKRRRYEN